MSTQESPPGWRLPGYTELRELGAGAQGRVVLARRPEPGDVVAVKYLTRDLLADTQSRSVFRNEAVMLSRVESPNVARLYEYIEADAGAAIVMEAVNGVSLRAVLKEREGPLPAEAALVVLKGSLLGLAAAHAVGVIHRDYKPANVIVQEDGQSKLIDFGVAVLTGQGGASGTLAYMAPEQAEGQPASPATDIYAATCVFYECVAGHRPYSAPDAAALVAQHRTAPVPLDDVPESLHPLILQGMAKRPERRLWDANRLVAELETIAEATCGKGWEQRGWAMLKAAAAVLAAAFPVALLGSTAASGAALAGSALTTGTTAVQTGAKGLLVKIGGAKVAVGVAGVAAVGVTAGFLLWPDSGYRHAWTADITPASSINPVKGGFALYSRSSSGTFEVVKLDGRTGKVRWRQPASPSYTVQGVGMILEASGNSIVFMRPVGDYTRGLVEVVAVDSVSGKRIWSYGQRGMYVISRPGRCLEGESRLCFSQYYPNRNRGEVVVLDGKAGRLTARTFPLDGRELSDQLQSSADDQDLVRFTLAGQEVWRRPMNKVFDAPVNPDRGWDVQLRQGRYVGEIGHVRSFSQKEKIWHLDRSVTAGFDAATGRTLWTQPGTTVMCGVIEFDLDEPIRCRNRGQSIRAKPSEQPTFKELDVTVEGFDPATGRARWSWHAGAAPDLVASDLDAKKVLRVDDSTYLSMNNPRAPVLINARTGVKRLKGDLPVGWCSNHDSVKSLKITNTVSDEYLVRQFWPCRPSGKPAKVPETAPEFAGARYGDVFAWVSRTGIEAVHTK